MLVWQQYTTDIGRIYPFIPVNIRQLSNIGRDESPLLILPESDRNFAFEFNSFCPIKGISFRKIKVFFSDDSVYEFNYYRPFSLDLFHHLSSSISVRAFEFIGEEIRHSRLRRMLDNV